MILEYEIYICIFRSLNKLKILPEAYYLKLLNHNFNLFFYRYDDLHIFSRLGILRQLWPYCNPSKWRHHVKNHLQYTRINTVVIFTI